jgi:type IX secretion system PorP/SprF family membrane protein
VWAQDPAFSQLFSNRVYLNPAFTGIDQGHRLSMSTRALWRNLPKNLSTQSFSYDYQPCANPRIGVGIVGTRDVEGEGRLKSTDLAGVFAFHTYYSLRKTRKAQTAGSFSMSAQLGYTGRAIDLSGLVFGDQLDPVLGVVTPSSTQVSITNPANTFDIGGGFLLRQRIYFKKTKKDMRDVTVHIGIAAHHLNKPLIGFTGAGGKLPIKYTFHTGLIMQLSKHSFVIPAFRYVTQDYERTRHNVIDANVMYLYRKLFGGLSYRVNQFTKYNVNTDAIMFFAGYEFEFSRESDLRLTYSFDTNYKGVSVGNFFSHEISVIFILKGKCKSKLESKNICDYESKGLPSIF